jgi:mTERF domain-containing protein
MLGCNDASFRYLIESFPRLLLLSVEYRMKPLVEFLENIGVRRGFLINLILLFPPIIFCNVEVIKQRLLPFKEVL